MGDPSSGAAGLSKKFPKIAQFANKLRHRKDDATPVGFDAAPEVVDAVTDYPVHNPYPRNPSTRSLPPMADKAREMSRSSDDIPSRVNSADFVDVSDDEFSGMAEKTSLLDSLWEELRSPPKQAEKEEQPLKVHLLRQNARRFNHSLKLITSPFRALHDLSSWETPSRTILAMLAYFYCVYMGCVLLGALLFCLVSLGMAALQPASELADPKDAEKPKLTDRFRILFEVARKAQNKFGEIADALEKIINLVTWQRQANTLALAKALGAAVLVVAVLPHHLLVTILQVLAGIKLFFLQVIFLRLPSLRDRFDSLGRFWASLPTNAQLSQPSPVPVATGGPADRTGREEAVVDSFIGLFGTKPGKLVVTTKRVYFLHESNELASLQLQEIARVDKHGVLRRDLDIVGPNGFTLGFHIVSRDHAYEAIMAQCAKHE